MIASRQIDDLHPKVAKLATAFLALCNDTFKAQGVEVIITSTYRDNESQNALYSLGRAVAGKKVTNAKAGQSFHNYRLAFDFVPVKHGKALWNDANLFTECGKIAEGLGLEWAGRWVSFKEMAHCQYTGGLTLKDLQNGKTLS